MVQKLKFIFSLLFLTLFCFSSVAQEGSTEDNNLTLTNESSNESAKIDYGQYVSYVSEAGERESAIKITRSRIAKSIKNGNFFNSLGLAGEMGELVIPVSFTKKADNSNGLQGDEQDETSVISTGGGDIRCWDLQAQTPHLGEIFSGAPKVPKAKAIGKCEYIHYSGTPPPWVDFELRQVLIQIEVTDNWIPKGETAVYHRKTGLLVEWLANKVRQFPGTQVFGNCPPSGTHDIYVHDFQIEIYAPPGWTYTGSRPFAKAPEIASNQLSCP
jgi:hypothetical protein